MRHAKATLMGMVVSAIALAAMTGWQEELIDQARETESCEVALLTQVVETVRDGRHVILVKVHCRDRRTFDAIRRSDETAWNFRKCDDPQEDRC